MKKLILILSLCTIFSAPAFASSNCFMASENNKIIEQTGDCKTRHTPCSTFKIAISLMGYDDGFLTDETHPELPFKTGYPDFLEAWKEPHNPQKWLKNSCVWYSQAITQKLGAKKFSAYVKKFNYGNLDVSGDAKKNNGLTEAWLGSSLEISPQEQVQFLQKLLDGKLPVSEKSHQMTQNILFAEDLQNGWKLFGKTGSCDSTDKINQTGWFVGWIEKENRKIIFANYLEDQEKPDYSGGKRSKEQAKKRLMELVE